MIVSDYYKMNQGISCFSDDNGNESEWLLAASNDEDCKPYQPLIDNSSVKLIENSHHYSDCNRINSYPSPVITLYFDAYRSHYSDVEKNSMIPIHIMLDCGASVSFITSSKCKDLNIENHIQPAGQLALQADGKT